MVKKIIGNLSSGKEQCLSYLHHFPTETYSDGSIVQELLAQITWYHHIALPDKVKDAKEREW